MDELVQEVSRKTGLSQDQSRAAVEAVLGVLKERLPEPARSMVDQYAGGQASAQDAAQAVQGAQSQSGSVVDTVKNIFKG